MAAKLASLLIDEGLIIEICSYLDMPDLLTMAQTSRKLLYLASHDYVWRKFTRVCFPYVEVVVNGVSSPPFLFAKCKEASLAAHRSTEDLRLLHRYNRRTAAFRWRIKGFSQLSGKVYSRRFTVNGQGWRVLVYPKGNHSPHLSVYLDVPEAPSLPMDWRRTAFFQLYVMNQVVPRYSRMQYFCKEDFRKENPDWGWRDFMPLAEVFRQGSGFLRQDVMVLEFVVCTPLPPEGHISAHHSLLRLHLD